MHQAFGIHAAMHPGLAQQVDHALFEHPGADAFQYVARGLALDDHVGDTRLVKQLAEQQPGGAGADDGNLGACGDRHTNDLETVFYDWTALHLSLPGDGLEAPGRQ
jgi:hypothetical protein